MEQNKDKNLKHDINLSVIKGNNYFSLNEIKAFLKDFGVSFIKRNYIK